MKSRIILPFFLVLFATTILCSCEIAKTDSTTDETTANQELEDDIDIDHKNIVLKHDLITTAYAPAI